MAIGILVVGESGTGKSRSTKTLPSKETCFIKCHNKPLPYASPYPPEIAKKKITEGGYILNSHSSQTIVQALEYISEKRKDIKIIIIDDFQYVMSKEFMSRAKERGFDKFTDIAVMAYRIFEKIETLRDDLRVYVLTHSQEDKYGTRKVKTVGQLTDQHMTIEGLFTIVLFSAVARVEDKNQYYFETQSNNTTAKSPEGLFEQTDIPNDLKFVDDSICKYYAI